MADLLGVNPRLRRSLLATWAIAKPQWMCEMSRYDCEALIRKSSEPRPHKLSIEFLAEWKMLILDSISSSSLLLWHGANTHRRALLNLLFSWSIFLSMEKTLPVADSNEWTKTKNCFWNCARANKLTHASKPFFSTSSTARRWLNWLINCAVLKHFDGSFFAVIGLMAGCLEMWIRWAIELTRVEYGLSGLSNIKYTPCCGCQFDDSKFYINSEFYFLNQLFLLNSMNTST